MYAAYPVYMPSNRYARENGEIELWRESYKINIDCRNYINENAGLAYHERNLPDFMQKLTDNFGLDRAMFVTARFIVAADWGGRYGKDVKERAAQVDFQDMKEGKALFELGQDQYKSADWTRDLYSNVHPCILNDIFRALMKMERENNYLPADVTSRDNERDEGAEM